MSLNPNTSFRRGAFALTTAAALAMGSVMPAAGQTVVKSTPVNAPAVQTVSKGDCAAFGKYVLDEEARFGNEISGTFLEGVSRFVAAKCNARDAKGAIQLITETRRDAITFGVARDRMGKIDILGISGVAHCHRPESGVCPTRTTGTSARPASGS